MTPAETQVQTLLGRPIERIAVVRALYLGDLLLAIPALRSLRAGFPDAEITLIGLPWAREFVQRFDRYVDDFVVMPGFPGIDEVPVDATRTAAFLGQQRARHFDLVIQMHGSGRTSNALALALGGAITAGYREASSQPTLNLSAPYPTAIPEIDRNLGIAAMLGCPDGNRGLEFPVSRTDIAEADALVAELGVPGRPLIGVHPGAKFPSRRWMPERFAEAAATLARESDAAVLVTGTAAELPLAESVAAVVGERAHIAAGRTSLGGLAALIERMSLFVSNDTGPAHIAAALGTPSVTIFGPADVRRWAPADRARHAVVHHPVACSPCGHATCPIDHRCLRSITAAEVVEAARQVMSREASSCTA